MRGQRDADASGPAAKRMLKKRKWMNDLKRLVVKRKNEDGLHPRMRSSLNVVPQRRRNQKKNEEKEDDIGRRPEAPCLCCHLNSSCLLPLESLCWRSSRVVLRKMKKG